MAGHRATRNLVSRLQAIPKKEDRARVYLSAAEANDIKMLLREDAKDYYFSGLLSFVEALRGPQCGLYSWATVKLYYSVFYTLRAILALRGIAIFYLASTPWLIRAEPGKTAEHSKGNTHSVVLRSFEQCFRRHILVQNIGADEAAEWLMDRREDANYKLGRFSEPTVPTHFEFLEKTGIRKALQMYLHRDNEMLAFQPEHAMIAYPFLALRYAKHEFEALHVDPLSADDRATLSPHCRDASGYLTDLVRFL